jgi:hypothetical protein
MLEPEEEAELAQALGRLTEVITAATAAAAAQVAEIRAETRQREVALLERWWML